MKRKNNDFFALELPIILMAIIVLFSIVVVEQTGFVIKSSSQSYTIGDSQTGISTDTNPSGSYSFKSGITPQQPSSKLTSKSFKIVREIAKVPEKAEPKTQQNASSTTEVVASSNATSETAGNQTVEATFQQGPSAQPIPIKEHLFSNLIPGFTSKVKNFSEESGIEEIQIEVKNKTENVKVSVTKYEDKPIEEISVENLSTIYQYLQINVDNIGENLDIATVVIKIEKLWLSENNISKDKLSLFKYNESSKELVEFAATYINEDENYSYYSVKLRSFSYFIIGESTTDENETSLNETSQEQNSSENNSIADSSSSEGSTGGSGGSGSSGGGSSSSSSSSEQTESTASKIKSGIESVLKNLLESEKTEDKNATLGEGVVDNAVKIKESRLKIYLVIFLALSIMIFLFFILFKIIKRRMLDQQTGYGMDKPEKF